MKPVRYSDLKEALNAAEAKINRLQGELALAGMELEHLRKQVVVEANPNIEPNKVHWDALTSIVAFQFGIEVDALKSRKRLPHYVAARICAAKLWMDTTGESLVHTAQRINRDHSTLIPLLEKHSQGYYMQVEAYRLAIRKAEIVWKDYARSINKVEHNKE